MICVNFFTKKKKRGESAPLNVVVVVQSTLPPAFEMDEHNGETIRRTSSGAPMPPPIALGGARGGAVAAGEQQQMQSQSQMPNPSAAPATTTSATMASSSASPSRSASAALNGYSSDDCGGGSRSARMRAVRAGRSQPFFIGVAGE